MNTAIEKYIEDLHSHVGVGSGETWIYTTLSTGGAIILKYSGPPIVTVPLSILADKIYHPVEAIGNNAFASNQTLTNLTIPQDLKMYDSVCKGCPLLETINMSNLKTMGTLQMTSCPSLKNVNMPFVETVNISSFQYCTSLAQIDMPSVTTILDYAFEKDTALKKISMPKVTSIGHYAFSGCSSLTELILPMELSSFGYNVFIGCPITSITIDYGTKDISYVTINDWNKFVSKLTGINVSKVTGKFVKNNTRIRELPDTIPPVLTLYGETSMTLEINELFIDPGASAIDDSGATIKVKASSFDTTKVGEFTITYTAIDPSGNISTATRNVTVADTIPPVINLFGDTSMTLEINEPFIDPGYSAIDNSRATISITTSGTIDISKIGVYTLTYTAIDPSGNLSTATRTITIVDTIPPVITLIGTSTMNIEINSSFIDPGVIVIDDSKAVITPSISNNLDLSKIGVYAIIYTAIDPSGNTSTTTRTINVIDTIPPVIALEGPNPMTVEINTPYIEPGASAIDNSKAIINVTSSTDVDVSKLGLYKVTYTAIDPSGNTSTTIRIVNIVDTIPPVITLNGPSSISVEINTSYIDAGASATDNSKTTINVITSGIVDITKVMGYTLTYTAIDSSGNTSTATRMVYVIDTIPPVITLNGASLITVEINSSFTDPWVNVTDNSKATINASVSSDFDISKVGVYTLTYTAIDPSGNTSTAIRTVEVVDTIPPVITLNGSNPMTIEINTPYIEPGASAMDNSKAIINVAYSDNVNVSKLGIYNLTYTAIDPSGNISTATRTVNVVDTISPVITLNGDSTMTLFVNSYYYEPGAVVTDNSLELITPVISGYVDPRKVGQYIISYNATDSSGNKAKQVQRTINIIYNYSGLLYPLDKTTNTLKANIPIMVRFQLKDANDKYISSATAKLYYYQTFNGSIELSEAISVFYPNNGNIFSYEESCNIYVFSLDTTPMDKGTFTLIITLDDDQVYYNIQIILV